MPQADGFDLANVGQAKEPVRVGPCESVANQVHCSRNKKLSQAEARLTAFTQQPVAEPYVRAFPVPEVFFRTRSTMSSFATDPHRPTQTTDYYRVAKWILMN